MEEEERKANKDRLWHLPVLALQFGGGGVSRFLSRLVCKGGALGTCYAVSSEAKMNML